MHRGGSHLAHEVHVLVSTPHVLHHFLQPIEALHLGRAICQDDDPRERTGESHAPLGTHRAAWRRAHDCRRRHFQPFLRLEELTNGNQFVQIDCVRMRMLGSPPACLANSWLGVGRSGCARSKSDNVTLFKVSTVSVREIRLSRS